MPNWGDRKQNEKERIICHLESSMIIQALRSWLMIERGYDSTITPSLHLDENNEIFATL